MNEPTDQSAMIAALQAQLAGLQQQPTAGMQPTAPNVAVTGVGVPIKIQTPDGGSIRIDLMLPPDAAANPQTLMATLQHLQAQGWPLDIWKPRNQQGSGWNRSGGGWNSGGGGGRW